MSSFLFSSYLLHFNCKFVVQKNPGFIPGAWMQTSVGHVLSKSGPQARPNRGNHLSQRKMRSPGIASIRYPKLPYRSLGLPLEGFTAFHR